MSLLAAVNLSDATETLIYTNAGATDKVVTVNVCARSAVNKIRLAVVNNATPSVQNYIEYDAEIPASGVLERTGIVLGQNDRIYCKTDTSAVSVVVWGM